MGDEAEWCGKWKCIHAHVFICPASLCFLKWGEVAQLCPTLCDPVDCSLLGSSVLGIFKARMLEWVAISFSRGSSHPRDWTQVSYIVGRCFTSEPPMSFNTPIAFNVIINVYDPVIIFFFILFYFFIFYIVVDFVIHWNEIAMGLHVFPIPIPPPTSLSTWSL